MSDSQRYRELLAELADLADALPAEPGDRSDETTARLVRQHRDRVQAAREIDDKLLRLRPRLARLADRIALPPGSLGPSASLAGQADQPPADVLGAQRALKAIEADVVAAERSAAWIDRNRPLAASAAGQAPRDPGLPLTLPDAAGVTPDSANGSNAGHGAWLKVTILVLVLVVVAICVLSFR